MKRKPRPIRWTGDLEDDCVAQWNGMLAHAECMDHNYWYCGVYKIDKRCKFGNGPTIFHSTEEDIVPLTGKSARWLCELIMKNERTRNSARR